MSVSPVDKVALVALYNATDGPNWTDNTYWLTDTTIDQWHGITTGGAGRVTSLDLRENGLTGEIPPELGNFASLEILNLFENELSGEIPPELGDLVHLQSLYLAKNQLTSEIPPELGDLANLQ